MLEFTYDGLVKELTAVEDCNIRFKLIGAGGGGGATQGNMAAMAGVDGAVVTGMVSLSAGEKLYCAVGQGGFGANGANGGVGGKSLISTGGTGEFVSSASADMAGAGGGGGGASILFKKRSIVGDAASPKNYDFIAIAGGGGGGGGASKTESATSYSPAVYGLRTEDFSKQAFFAGVQARGCGPALGFGALSIPPIQQVEYDSAGSYEYIVPSGVYKLSVLLIGGGGSGADGSDPTSNASGGRAGSVSTKIVTVQPGDVLEFVVGAGGTGVLYESGEPGQNGESTSLFKNGVLELSTAGGTGGIKPNSTLSASGASCIFGSEVVGLGGTFYSGVAGSSGTRGGGGSAVRDNAYGQRSGNGGDGFALIRQTDELIAYINNNSSVRFDSGIVPILTSFKPDNSAAPTGNLVLAGRSVTQYQLSLLGIDPASTIYAASGDTISWSIDAFIDHAVKFGYWIWDSRQRITPSAPTIVFQKTYTSTNRQQQIENGTVTVPSTFTENSILVFAIGDVNSSCPTGMHSVNVQVTVQQAVMSGEDAVVDSPQNRGGRGGGGSGLFGGTAYPVVTGKNNGGKSGSRGQSFSLSNGIDFTIGPSAPFIAEQGNGGNAGIIASRGQHGYAAFEVETISSGIKVKTGSEWVSVKDVRVRINGQWQNINSLKVKNGSSWSTIVDKVQLNYTSTMFPQ